MAIDSALEGIVKQNADKQVQKGAAFLNGDTASATLKTATTAVGAGVVATQLTQASTEELQEVAQQLMAAAAAKITEESAKLTAEFAVKNATLLASIPGKISSAASDKLNEPGAKKELGDVLADLNKNREDIEEEKSKKMDEENQKKTLDDTKEKAAEGANKVKEFMENANAELEKIVGYAAEGPDYVADQLTKKINSVLDNIKKTLDESYNNNEKKLNEYCQGEGEKIGTRMVESYNNTVDKAAKKIKDDKDKAMASTEIKAKSAIQKAKLQLMALVGA